MTEQEYELCTACDRDGDVQMSHCYVKCPHCDGTKRRPVTRRKTFTCRCQGFAVRPQPIEADSMPKAAQQFAKHNLPGPDLWGQIREIEYEVLVTCPDGEEVSVTVHAYQTTVWGIGRLEDG